MATTFQFYAFPDRTRLRLSQIFVPPPHQHRGVGRALLQAVYDTAVERDALDVTVSLALGASEHPMLRAEQPLCDLF